MQGCLFIWVFRKLELEFGLERIAGAGLMRSNKRIPGSLSGKLRFETVCNVLPKRWPSVLQKRRKQFYN